MDCSGLDSEDEVRLQWHWLVLQCHAELLNRALVTSGGDFAPWGTFKSEAEARKSEAAPCSASMFIDGAGEGEVQADGV